jgi:exonuclease VII small subunit
MFEKFILWVAGRVLGFLSPRRIWRWLKTPAVMIAGGTHFSVVMADLADDVDLKQTGHVGRILGGQKGIKVLRNGQVLRIAEFGDQAENLIDAEKRGQQWLDQHDADVLVWGEVAGANQVLRLRFLSRTGRIGSDTKGYPLTETLELPTEFHVDFGQVLYMTALSAVGPATEMQGKYLVDLLRPAARKVERLLDRPPPGLPPETIAHVHVAYGMAATVLGEQMGDSAWLTRAEISFRTALDVYTRDQAPVQWAMTQNSLGTALWALGEREEGTARLEEAVTAYRAALEVYTRDRAPLQWAMTQNNLGNALQTLGRHEKGTALLEEAVTAYRAALEEGPRDRLPLDWAITQHNLGSALATLGGREEGTARLKEAVTAYRAALEERTRDRVPLQWAMTQNNLGSALSRLGEREEGTARLEEAVTAYRAALEVYTRDPATACRWVGR